MSILYGAGLVQGERKDPGRWGLVWRTLMTKAHITGKENFVSSKARTWNQLNRIVAAPGAEVGGEFKQIRKMHQS